MGHSPLGLGFALLGQLHTHCSDSDRGRVAGVGDSEAGGGEPALPETWDEKI